VLKHQRVISRDQRQGRARIAGFGGTQQQLRRRDIAVVQIGLAALERLPSSSRRGDGLRVAALCII